jgi:hypothetical protein
VVVRPALDSAEAYAARDALSHDTCLAHTTVDASQALTKMLRESGLVTPSGLGRGALQGPIFDSLIDSAQVAKTHWPRRCLSRVITADCTEHAKTPRSPESRGLARRAVLQAGGPDSASNM